MAGDFFEPGSPTVAAYRLGPSRQLGFNTKPKNDAYEFSPNAPVTHAAFWFLWPNITFNMLPGETQLSVAIVQPKGVEQCVFWAHIYGHKAERDPARVAYGRDVLGPEDTSLCESVQRGLHCRVYKQGRIIVDPERSGIAEQGIHHFHRMVKSGRSTCLNRKASTASLSSRSSSTIRVVKDSLT